MPDNEQGRKPAEKPAKAEETKNNQYQEGLSDMLKMLIAFVLSCIGWNKDKKEGKPAINIDKTTGNSKYGDKNVYRIAVRDNVDSSTEEVSDNLLHLMTTESPKAVEKAESEGHDPIYGLVMSILYKLQRLDRYKMIEIVQDGQNCILAVFPKNVHLNYTNADLKTTMRLAITGKNAAQRIQHRIEANLTMQLLALTGELKVGMEKDAPSIIVVYAPQGDKTSYHNIKLVASMTIVNKNTEMKWVSGKREIRAFKGRKEVKAITINTMLKKAKFTLKGEKKIFQIVYNKKTKGFNWKQAADGLEQAKAAGAISANINFKRVWTQDGNQPVQDIGFGTVAGILSSLTNGTNSGKTSHIVVDKLRSKFVNISLKRLLAGHPTEVSLLNEENQNLTQKLRLLLGLETYKMPAVVTTENENWSFQNKDDLSALLQSGVIKAWKENDVKALLNASKVEPVAHQELNRWFVHTGLTHTVGESEFTVADEEHTMLDIVVAETKTEKEAPQAQ